MKGVIFNVVEETVRAEHGEDAWDSLLDAAGLSGAYTSLGTYPDQDMAALVTAASEMLGVSQEDLLRHLGRQGFGRLAARNAEPMTEFGDARSLLLGLNSVIHPEVRKVYPGADVPVFEVVSGESESISLSYRSKRGLCHFAEGLALGVGDLFGETFTVTQPVCQHQGGDHCELKFTWPPDGT
jgi:Haem-NO-binding